MNNKTHLRKRPRQLSQYGKKVTGWRIELTTSDFSHRQEMLGFSEEKKV